jgi:hypothetical protein
MDALTYFNILTVAVFGKLLLVTGGWFLASGLWWLSPEG